MKEESISILDLNNQKAKEEFLKKDSYINFDLPPYFDFTNLLAKIDNKVKNKNWGDIKQTNPGDYEDVNYKILANKDGKFAWRPLEIMNPVIYVYLVNILTEEKNWKLIKTFFIKRRSSSLISSLSMPVFSMDNNKDRGNQINKWLDGIEKKSLELSLDYKYILFTDIRDCYGSIYTHLIPRAIYGVKKAKEEKGNKTLLGNIIDLCIQSMRFNQTNGIPQGSVLMDFIAEIILIEIDSKLTKAIKKEGIKQVDFKILRYRDDYRIFCSTAEVSNLIIKLLSQILAYDGFHLNTEKTFENQDVILASLKKDKWYRKTVFTKTPDYKNQLLKIYSLAKKYPNSGALIFELSKFGKSLKDFLDKGKKISKKYKECLVAIISDIMIDSPRSYEMCMNILSLIIFNESKSIQRQLLKRVYLKLEKKANNEIQQLWLKRLYKGFKIQYPNGKQSKLMQLSSKKISGEKLWNTTWAKNDISDIIKTTPIVNLDTIKKLTPVVQTEEFSPFTKNLSL